MIFGRSSGGAGCSATAKQLASTQHVSTTVTEMVVVHFMLIPAVCEFPLPGMPYRIKITAKRTACHLPAETSNHIQ